MASDYDSPWKDMLDNYFPAFMRLFLPDAYKETDWSQGYEILDTELRQIVRDADTGRRYADKLMKVYLQDGSALFVFVHTEVQAQYDAEFTQRMFTYNYRIFDRYSEPVVSLAVLADENEKWRPSTYNHARWGCSLNFHFPVIKLTDYRWDWSSLEASDNPFATVVMAHLKTQDTHEASNDRRYWKMRLMRRMYERGFARQTILDIFHFIDWLMTLPEELEQAFEDELETYEKERNMPYVTHIERRGREEGMQVGEKKGEFKVLQLQLENRFGEIPQHYRKRLEQADSDTLLRWSERILTAQNIEEVFAEK
jgi:hypothetical protein